MFSLSHHSTASLHDSGLSFDVLRSSRERVKEEKIKTALHTVNRLKFNELGLYGRGEEVKTLNECLARVSETIKRKKNNVESDNNGGGSMRTELALIYGESGVGKTRLALALEKPVICQGGILVSGKYEQSLKDLPFAAISTACNMLCQKATRLNPNSEKYQQIRHDLKAAELRELRRVVGKLPLLLDDEESTADEKESQEKEGTTIFKIGDEEKEQLNSSMISFFRIFSNHFAPLVLLLDDLQWIDASSLEFIRTRLSKLPAEVMVVGSIRSSEIDGEHIFVKTLQQLKVQPESFRITEISVGDLSVDDIKGMLGDLLLVESSSSSLDQLAEVCHSRTHGNVYFVKQFLAVLEEDGFLTFDVGTFRWHWDITVIEQHTFATSNLVDLIQSRMKKLGKDALHVMILASCLGNTFDCETLYLLWEKERNLPSTEKQHGTSTDFKALLKMILDDLCFEAMGTPSSNACEAGGVSCRDIESIENTETLSDTYRFAHDKIQEATLSLIPEDDISGLHHRLGMILFQHLSKDKLESSLFVVANLLNNGIHDSVDIAHLNLRAAIKANNVSAYSSVAHYAQKGIENLFNNHGDDSKVWHDHFDLVLKLYSLLASAQKELGDIESAEQCCEKVLQQKRATPLQKCLVWQVKLAIYHNQGKEDALELALEYLGELGCKLPKWKIAQKVQTSLYLRQTKKDFILTQDEFLKIPSMTEQEKIWALSLLEEAGSLAYVLQNGPLYTLIRFKFIRWIKKHGLTKDSASSLASFANVLAHKYGEFDTAKQFAEMSLVLQEYKGSWFSEARTVTTAFGNVLSWIHPIQSTLKHYLSGYRSGMKSGNLFSAGTCIMYYIVAAFQSGTNLKLLLEDCQTYIAQLDRFKLTIGADVVRSFWQTVENLIGSVNTTELSGSVIKNEKKFFESTAVKAAVFPTKCCALVHFGKFEEGAALALEIGTDSLRKGFPGFGYGYEQMPFGLCLYAAASQSTLLPKMKCLREADKVRSHLRYLVKNGCVNLVHHLHLLDAEYHALNGKEGAALSSYNTAAVEAARGGFIQDAGIINERLADYFFRNGRTDDASYHLEQSIHFYKEWGSDAKVSQLEMKFTDLFHKQ